MKLLRRLETLVERRRAMRALDELDAHILRDIGFEERPRWDVINRMLRDQRRNRA